MAQCTAPRQGHRGDSKAERACPVHGIKATPVGSLGSPPAAPPPQRGRALTTAEVMTAIRAVRPIDIGACDVVDQVPSDKLLLSEYASWMITSRVPIEDLGMDLVARAYLTVESERDGDGEHAITADFEGCVVRSGEAFDRERSFHVGTNYDRALGEAFKGETSWVANPDEGADILAAVTDHRTDVVLEVLDKEWGGVLVHEIAYAHTLVRLGVDPRNDEAVGRLGLAMKGDEAFIGDPDQWDESLPSREEVELTLAMYPNP